MSSQNTNTPGAGSTSRTDTASASERTSPSTAITRQQGGAIVLAVVAAIIAGAVVATMLFGVVGTSSSDNPDGAVAVVSIEGPIMEPIGEDLEDELREIRANDSIDAVVLKMDTPGGQPAPTERMYMSIQRTSEQMPVVASVQEMSASAGYYMMLPAEDIYVLPTSVVGSVGLAAGAPQASPPAEGPSGPDKRGSNVIHDWAQQETLGDIFIESVMEQRGDRIELDREGVSTAQVFTGVESVENGFADEVGSLDAAVQDAADRADLEEYTIVEREVGGAMAVPLLAQTDYGMVAIHDENPTIADVEPLNFAMVYEPAVPHITELEAVASPDLEDLADDVAEEAGGEVP